MESSTWNLESTDWNPESKTVLDSRTICQANKNKVPYTLSFELNQDLYTTEREKYTRERRDGLNRVSIQIIYF